MRLLISGGGTGGHIYPGLALANQAQKRLKESEVIFVGSEGGMETEIIPRAGYKLETIALEGLPRRISPKLITAVAKSFIGLFKARKIIKQFVPDVVIGTGGYVSGPILLAASLAGIPTIIHEQNAYPGVTNKLLAKVVDKVALTSKEAEKYFKQKDKLVWTGNPIRPEILAQDRSEAFEKLGFASKKRLVLIFGGSRGAKSINQAAVKLYQKFAKSNMQLLHITGNRDFAKIKRQAQAEGITDVNGGNVVLKSYLHQMEAGLAAADLVISRAGATALAEITACGIPAILVPYPHAAENHQEHNARALEKHGAAKVILDDKLTGELLEQSVIDLINNSQQLEQMAKRSKELGKPRAAENLLELVKGLTK